MNKVITYVCPICGYQSDKDCEVCPACRNGDSTSFYMRTLNGNSATIVATGSALHFYNNRLYTGCVYDDGSTGDIDVTEKVAEAISKYIKK